MSKSNSKRKSDEPDEATSSQLRKKHQFIRSTIRTDYQPDICKDYKETGFCGFGDSCKFLHDRSDYKHGWQLDQEWAKGEHKDEEDDKYLITASDDEDDQVPTTCTICDSDYRDPIVTKCQHYFCGACAEKDCSEKCFVCQKPTLGIFKNASKLIKPKPEAQPSRSSSTPDKGQGETEERKKSGDDNDDVDDDDEIRAADESDSDELTVSHGKDTKDDHYSDVEDDYYD